MAALLVTSSVQSQPSRAITNDVLRGTASTNNSRFSATSLVQRQAFKLSADHQGTNQSAAALAFQAEPVSRGAQTPETLSQPLSGLDQSSMSLTVTTPVLNVNFAGNTKVGFAAAGQTTTDYWNLFTAPGSPATLQNLFWSDQSPSDVDLTVTNGPGRWGHPFCLDPMHHSFLYPWDSGHIQVTITNLPPGVYDIFAYTPRLSESGAPYIDLVRSGVTLWTKGVTHWGQNWYSSYWDEHEQFVRFRGIAITNQPLVLDVFPDEWGMADLSGLQIVPAAALPVEQPPITRLLNIDFAGCNSFKQGPAAVGLGLGDYWNMECHAGLEAATMAGLAWSDQVSSPASVTVLNGPGVWGNNLPDPMFRNYFYSWDAGNVSIVLSNLAPGICDIYLYGHVLDPEWNAVFELWSDDVNWGTKGTSLVGYGHASAAWEIGQQYVVFRDVSVRAGIPVVIHAKHTYEGYNNVSGMQIAYTGDLDTDVDGLPDGWERTCFQGLAQTATGDADADGLTNLREYQLGTDPNRVDSNGNGVSDLADLEMVWIEDATPQSAYEAAYNESWFWTDYWWDGDGWGGQEITPRSGRVLFPAYMHISELAPDDLHQHCFWSSIETMRPGAGDTIYTYVNLDSSYPPSEIMLQWYVLGEDGMPSWEHRVYWGTNAIEFGVDGTESRHYMGPVPTAGEWLRLEVPASLVGLEGKVVEGMAFTLFGGRAAWDSTGIIKLDRDGDAMLDSWEIQNFGTLAQLPGTDADADGLSNEQEFTLGTNPTDADSDGDGLTDGEETRIYRDFYHQSLGHLNPLAIDTGSTGTLDGNKDGDGDGLSNLSELRKYGSLPWTPHSFSQTVPDAECLFSAYANTSKPLVELGIFFDITTGVYYCWIIDGMANHEYDVYCVHDIGAQRWQWYRTKGGIKADGNGEAFFTLEDSGLPTFFVVLDAEDEDEDGLSNGYEAWFSYGGRRTDPTIPDSDNDKMDDGWEVTYGLDPTDADPSGDHGAQGNPDGDAYPNWSANGQSEWEKNPDMSDPSYDPFKPHGSSTPGLQARPIVSITTSQSETLLPGQVATFTITRVVGLGANLNQSLTVYYSLGGSAEYGTDYALTPSPGGPRVPLQPECPFFESELRYFS